MDNKISRNEYKSQYNRDNYDRIQLYLPKGIKDELKIISSNKGISVNALINTALQDYIAQNKTDSN